MSVVGIDRSRRWLWAGLLTVLGIAGFTSWWWMPLLHRVLAGYLDLSWEDRDQRASVIGVVIGMVSVVTSIVLSIVQMHQARRLTGVATTPVEPSREAVRQLRTHLGPDQRLPRMRTVSARVARVHSALGLSPSITGEHRRRWWVQWWRDGVELDTELPLFVPRQVWPEIVKCMRRARRQGGFLLLVGNSSVGKTRLLFEAARSELGDFRVVVPDLGDGGIVNALAAANGKSGPLIVWLDELQRFLPCPYFAPNEAAGHTPITAAAIRHLLQCDNPVIVLATLWPGYAQQLHATETDLDTGVTRPRYPQALDVLTLITDDLTVTTFSKVERRKATRLSGRDPRLRTAIADRDFNVTEALAGARQILRRYRQALPEHQAVVHAAVDAHRMGIQGPLTLDLLRDAARGYLTGIHPDDTWFDDALAELTCTDRRDDAATAPLIPVPDAHHRTNLGYTVADYLLQHLLPQRRSHLLTDITWYALDHHTHARGDRARLADNASRRMQYRQATHLYHTLADADDDNATRWLADLLAEQGKVEEVTKLLHVRADGDDDYAAYRLAGLLVVHGRVKELRARVDDGDGYAARRLADLLVEQGKIEEAKELLQARSDSGDRYAATRLADLLVEQRKAAEAKELLQARSDSGDRYATYRLADLLVEQGKIEEAKELLQARSDGGDRYAATRLGDLWMIQMYPELTPKLLRRRARAGGSDGYAARRLADLLDGQGKVDEATKLFRTQANDGDDYAAYQLAGLLAEQGRIEELRARADDGDNRAAYKLACVLDVQEKVEQATILIITHTDSSGVNNTRRLPAKQWKLEELRARADRGDDRAAYRLVGLLAEQGRIEELRARADHGDDRAAYRLVDSLAKQRRGEELWQEVHAGTKSAGYRLIETLVEQGKDEDAERLRTWGLTSNGSPAAPW